MPAHRWLLALGLLAAAQASAQVYKCTDASGKPFYSQSPCPPGATSKVISRKSPASADAASATPGSVKPPANPEAEFRKRQRDRADAEKKADELAADAKRKQENCQRAREEVMQYSAGVRIMRLDEKGERYYLDDAQREQEKARAQGMVEQFCN